MITRTTISQDKDLSEMLTKKAVVEIQMDAGYVLVWVLENFTVEEVFPTSLLDEWAEANGYVKEE